MAMVVVDDSCLQADSQPKSLLLLLLSCALSSCGAVYCNRSCLWVCDSRRAVSKPYYSQRAQCLRLSERFFHHYYSRNGRSLSSNMKTYLSLLLTADQHKLFVSVRLPPRWVHGRSTHRAHLRGTHFLGSFATQPSPSTSSDNPSKVKTYLLLAVSSSTATCSLGIVTARGFVTVSI